MLCYLELEQERLVDLTQMCAQAALAAVVRRSVHGTVTHEDEPRCARAINVLHIVDKPVVLFRVLQEVVLGRHDDEVHGSVLVRIPQVANTI